MVGVPGFSVPFGLGGKTIAASEFSAEDFKANEKHFRDEGYSSAAEVRRAQNSAALSNQQDSLMHRLSEATKDGLLDAAEADYQAKHPDEARGAATPATPSLRISRFSRINAIWATGESDIFAGK
jgi:hypothetical protein